MRSSRCLLKEKKANEILFYYRAFIFAENKNLNKIDCKIECDKH